MRYSIFILAFLMTWALHCTGQNKTTKEGLKVGKWTHTYELAYGTFTDIGYYKIIPLKTYDTIRSPAGYSLRVKYKGSTPMLFIYGRHHNKISVKDDLWQTTDSTGHTCRTDYWDQGLYLWSKNFDDKGNLTEYDYKDFENDTSFYLIYKNNQLYKKAYYPPENKNEETDIFYPNNNLIIPNAEPFFETNFGSAAVNIFQLNLSCKKDLTIHSISSSSENIQIRFPSKTLPYHLTTKDTVTFNLIFTPTPISFRDHDTITIVTSEENVQPYKMYCTLSAAHIDYRNVETISELTLSKSRDRYLVISPMGTETNVFISNSQMEKKYGIHGITKIDLNELNVGDNHVSISSCNIGGDLKLTITE